MRGEEIGRGEGGVARGVKEKGKEGRSGGQSGEGMFGVWERERGKGRGKGGGGKGGRGGMRLGKREGKLGMEGLDGYG